MTPTNRPRVEGEREEEILAAAYAQLLAVGYDRLTMDAVAKAARASKATLYRRWESKALLVIDALAAQKGHVGIGVPDTGTLRGDLLSLYCGSGGIATEDLSRTLAAMLSAVAADPEFAELFRSRFIAPKLAASAALYRRAQERGEIPADADLDVIGPALAGVVMHRRFVIGRPATDDEVIRVIDHLILPALGVRPEPAGRPTT